VYIAGVFLYLNLFYQRDIITDGRLINAALFVEKSIYIFTFKIKEKSNLRRIKILWKRGVNMFDINIHFDDIHISSIVRQDIIQIQKWINNQDVYGGKALVKPLDLDEFVERFIEYYMSESEFFLKVEKSGELIGIFKGRVEFKNPNEALIWCYILDKPLRGNGYGTKILNNILAYFKDNLGIVNFSTGIVEGNNRAVKFWNKNGFNLLRISKDFFNIEGKEFDMLIFRRQD
jgi:RimJ/RimL family protein N-acetyltransferase